MELQLDALRDQLAARDLDFSHIAMKKNGETVYLVNDVFISPTEAEKVALGIDTIEELRKRGDSQPGPTGFAWIAAASAVTPVAKAVYDVTKDGWEKLKPSPHLRIDILDSTPENDGHVVTVSVSNLSRSGIYVDSVSIVNIIDESEKLSLKQPTVRFRVARDKTFGDTAITPLPALLKPKIAQTFNMFCPALFHNGGRRTYGVADLHYSKLDEPTSDRASFTFRLR